MEATIDYRDGETRLSGFFAVPTGTGPFPGVLIGLTWLGINDSIKQRARRIAQLGYAAFVADIFAKQTDLDAGPRAMVGPFMADRLLFRRRMTAGLDALRSQPVCNKIKVAAIGYCFGGCGVLELARGGADLRGIVSFHGELDTPFPAVPGAIKGKVLICHGDADPVVSWNKVARFCDEMRAAETNWELDIYSGAKHSFTGEGSLGAERTPEAVLQPQAESRSCSAMVRFLDEVFSE